MRRTRSNPFGAFFMLVTVGNVEADVKVAAVMSTPRLGFMDNFFCVTSALTPHGISPTKVTSAFWGQSLQRAIEDVIDENDVILTIDYDSVFNAKTVEALLTLLMFSGYDAIAPIQMKREANSAIFSVEGSDVHGEYDVPDDWFEKPVQPVATAHFGLTFIRTAAIKRMTKPWFLFEANDEGTWTGGHVDEDLYFWKNFVGAGNRLGVATNVSIGHAELMVSWPSRCTQGGKVYQHTTDYWKQRIAPEAAWGVVK